MLQAQPGSKQTGFLVLAQFVEVIDRFPKLFRGHLQVFDDVHRVAQDPVNQRLGARVAAVVEAAAGFFEKLLGVGSLGKSDGHGAILILSLLGAKQAQRSSSRIDEGCRHRALISMVI